MFTVGFWRTSTFLGHTLNWWKPQDFKQALPRILLPCGRFSLRKKTITLTGAFGAFRGSVAEREVPCYLPRSFSHQVDRSSSRNIVGGLYQILTHDTVTSAFTEDQLSYKTRSQ